MDGIDKVDCIVVNSIHFWQTCPQNRLRSLWQQYSQRVQPSRTTICSPSCVDNPNRPKNAALSFDGSNEIRTEESPNTDVGSRALLGLASTSPSTAPSRRSSSTDTVKRIVPEPAKVHFADTPPLRATSNPVQSALPSFNNPFSSSHEVQSRRESVLSDESNISESSLPSTFTGHRDTLARLHDALSIDEDDDWGTYTPTQAGLSLFRSTEHNNRRHRDTLARLHFKQNNSKTLPDHILEGIAAHLGRTDYNNMRLTCRRWADHFPRPRSAIAQHLPAEILLEIYKSMQPPHYDAARHTCKLWFLVGLNYSLARTMLRTCGAYPAFLQDIELERAKLVTGQTLPDNADRMMEVCTTDQIDQEWLMGKRMATEARLSPSWKGNGIASAEARSSPVFNVVERVSFGKLAPTSRDQNTCSDPRHLTISGCGEYLMFSFGNEIIVYSLTNSSESLKPVVRLIASRRVVCVSMDTTSGRYAVAALLEGRLGLSWDLRSILSPQDAGTIASGEPIDLGMKTDVQGLTSLGASKPISMQGLFRSSSASTGTANTPTEQMETIQNLHGVVSYLTESPESNSPILTGLIEDAADLNFCLEPPAASSGLIPIITRPTTMYTSLGTGGDSPRSVAICPQRKCVAFGCRSGIELHWTDITTGSSLNRWFPLAAPSDHLYFLPQRPGVDTMKKLRLISSANGPSRYNQGRRESTPTKWTLRSTHPHTRGRLQSMTRLFFGSLPFPSALTRTNTGTRRSSEEDEQRGILRTIDCDHYRAVPISDGSHILFTDPATGLLCLGSDAPLGGPTKLMRKVCMIPPSSDDPDKASALVCYRACHDLRWGVRIVAAYDDGRVILYNLSADCFDRIRYIRSSPDIWDELAGVLGQSDLMMDVFMAGDQSVGTDNPNDNITDYATPPRRASVSSTASRSFRSLQVDGVVIWQADVEVEDVQVDCSHGGCKVWVFLRDGKAIRLDIYAPRNHSPLEKYVGADGLVHESGKRIKESSLETKGKGKERAGEFESAGVEDERLPRTRLGMVKFEV